MGNEMKEQIPQKPKGLILKEAREARGIGLDTVQAATKIPMDALKAIEEGYTVRSLSPFYLKGFMKMYAQYLGLDIREVIEDYAPEKLPRKVSQKPFSQIPSYFIPALDKKRQQQIVLVLGGLLFVFAIVKIASCGKKTGDASGTRPSAAAEKKETKAAAVSRTTKKKKAVTQTSTTAVSEKSAPAAAAEKAVSNVRLTVKATAKVWLQVKVDDNLVFQSTLQEGAAESWQAQNEIEISGRNISLLEYEVNGKILGTLGRAERGARRVVITQDGLSVKQ